MSSSITPSVPSATTTTATEPFSGRSLTPLEPQHAIPSYLTTQRRGSITDPSLHLSVPNPELARKYSQPDVNFQNSNSSERRGSFVDNFPPSPSSSFSRPSSVKSEQSLSPMETRKLRDTLPSISAGASPIKDGFPGPLMNPAFQAQIQQRRHSIAVGETFTPLKRKPSLNTPANPIHPLSPEEYPGKRRESYSDLTIQRLSLYDRRNSYSAPSSPPAPPQNSLASQSSSLPKLNINEVETSLQEHVNTCGINQYADIVISDLHTSSNISSSHISGGGSEPGDTFSPFNPRVSQLVQDDINTPVITRRASMPVMTFPSRFNETVGPQDPASIPMDVDRYRGQSGYTSHNHYHHPYPYDYPGYIQPNTPVKETPYSRSPELRISHKLAERKRRKEMKELFDELRDSLPVDKSLKTSKWEILSKAVDFINTLKQNQEEISKEVESLRQELAALKGGSDNTNASTS
ncbi:7641_t:CDS:2 [Ambispora leptoticha]|uniref:7641_t:CDS:1 n=1 Tax=Ambispora leptoticha TaxID=144679 RepID=A0A9N9B2I6_9GLOM|nr:7641_t:CDS:2 [Ambispora leptoticha]